MELPAERRSRRGHPYPAGGVGRWPGLPRHDYWLFDSSDLWVMEYADDGTFRWIEHVDDPGMIVRHAYWRDAALHQAIPYREYMKRAELLAAS